MWSTWCTYLVHEVDHVRQPVRPTAFVPDLTRISTNLTEHCYPVGSVGAVGHADGGGVHRFDE